MELKKTLHENNNALFGRKEIKVIVSSQINPTFDSSAEFIANKFSSDKENIAVRKIGGKFGANTFLLEANIYNSKEDKEKMEPKKKSKNGPAQGGQ